MDAGRLILRLVIGGFFVGHGTQKLFGWFGGGGLEGTGQFFSSLGLKPGRRNAVAAGVSEAGAGSLLALGLATPLAAAALISVMATALRTVHIKNGPWITEGGYEYTAVMIAALLALAGGGPGAVSLDRALGIERRGLGWLVLAAALGFGASAAAIEMGKQGAAAEPEPESAADVTATGEDAVTV